MLSARSSVSSGSQAEQLDIAWGHLELNNSMDQIQQVVHSVMASLGEIEMEAALMEENGMARVSFRQCVTIRPGQSLKVRLA